MQKYKISQSFHLDNGTRVTLRGYSLSVFAKLVLTIGRNVHAFNPESQWFRVYVSNKNSAQHIAYSYRADGRYCVDILVPNNEINDVFFRGVPFMDRLRLKYDIARAVRDCGMRAGLSGYDNLRVLIDYNRRQRSK